MATGWPLPWIPSDDGGAWLDPPINSADTEDTGFARSTQRHEWPVPDAPYPDPEGMAFTLSVAGEENPQLKTLQMSDLLVPTFVEELDKSGYIKKLYGR